MTNFCVCLFVNLEFKKSNLFWFLKPSSFPSRRSHQLAAYPKDIRLPSSQFLSVTPFTPISLKSYLKPDSILMTSGQSCYSLSFIFPVFPTLTSHHEHILHVLQNRSLEGNLTGQYHDLKAAHQVQYDKQSNRDVDSKNISPYDRWHTVDMDLITLFLPVSEKGGDRCCQETARTLEIHPQGKLGFSLLSVKICIL